MHHLDPFLKQSQFTGFANCFLLSLPLPFQPTPFPVSSMPLPCSFVSIHFFSNNLTMFYAVYAKRSRIILFPISHFITYYLLPYLFCSILSWLCFPFLLSRLLSCFYFGLNTLILSTSWRKTCAFSIIQELKNTVKISFEEATKSMITVTDVI